MRKKFVYPDNMLNKHKIFDLVFQSSISKNDRLAGYAEMHFGPLIFDEGFHRYSDKEVQDWYYREYLPDLEADIKEGYVAE